jgi:hypothetical protein
LTRHTRRVHQRRELLLVKLYYFSWGELNKSSSSLCQPGFLIFNRYYLIKVNIVKHLFAAFTCIILSYYSFGQNRTLACKCPVSIYAGTEADTVFNLSGNVSIALCGSKDTGIIKGKVLYSEFILSVCGSNKIIKFWDAVTLCDVKTAKDNLLVETIVSLPVGKSMQYEETVWTIERIYLVKGKTVRDSIINPKIPKYTQFQISNVLDLYNRSPNENSDQTIELADKLLIGAISGSEKAKTLLTNFRNKFTNLDGIYLEEYDSILRMLKQWEVK